MQINAAKSDTALGRDGWVNDILEPVTSRTQCIQLRSQSIHEGVAKHRHCASQMRIAKASVPRHHQQFAWMAISVGAESNEHVLKLASVQTVNVLRQTEGA